MIASNDEVAVSSTDSVASSGDELVSCGVEITRDELIASEEKVAVAEKTKKQINLSVSVDSAVSSHDMLVSCDDEAVVSGAAVANSVLKFTTTSSETNSPL